MRSIESAESAFQLAERGNQVCLGESVASIFREGVQDCDGIAIDRKELSNGRSNELLLDAMVDHRQQRVEVAVIVDDAHGLIVLGEDPSDQGFKEFLDSL